MHCLAFWWSQRELKMCFSQVDRAILWQPLFHIRSPDGSTVALMPWEILCQSWIDPLVIEGHIL